MNFEKGQIVKHKLNDKEMIVIGARSERVEREMFGASEKTVVETQIKCRYEGENREGKYFTYDWFYPEELTLIK